MPDGAVRFRRLSHGWRLTAGPEISPTLISGFMRPAVRAVPGGMARRTGPCRISIVETLENGRLVSQWTETESGFEISVAAGSKESPDDAHDVALELLSCLGQVLWTKLNQTERKAWWLLLDREIAAGVAGEIDEAALKQKRLLLGGRHSARSRRRLDLYGAASFAGTAAEYVHSLWHDVTIRAGPDFLPAPPLRRRLRLLLRWFPPSPGRRLFSEESRPCTAAVNSSSKLPC